jgi:hypothetical protein
MPPLPKLTRFPVKMFEEILERCGCQIHLIETFEDGMTRWGTDKEISPFTGSSSVADTTADGTITLTEVRAVLHKLDMAGHYPRIEEEVLKRTQQEHDAKKD